MGNGAKKPKHVDKEARRILAVNLRRKMEDRGDTQASLAAKCGFYQSRIQALLAKENGATIDTLALIARAVKCDLYELLIPPHQAGKLPAPEAHEALVKGREIYREPSKPPRAAKAQPARKRARK